jgi:heme o synthase
VLRTYIFLTKPGIIIGNLITTAGGFFLAAQGHIEAGLLIALLIGTSLVIASGCVFNNYIDRDIDRKMARTNKRATVTGGVSGAQALTYATILGIAGLSLLALFVNGLTVGIGIVGLCMYVVVYGIAKRKTEWGTVIGSISGAIPPVAGYTAVVNTLDTEAILLFIILTFWQMPHFYAIAMYRAKDYAAAGLPVLPIKRGMQAAKIQIIVYICGFVIAAALLTAFDYTGFIYLLVMTAIGITWLYKGGRGLWRRDNIRWAKDMFRFSLLVIMAFSLMISIDTFLP